MERVYKSDFRFFFLLDETEDEGKGKLVEELVVVKSSIPVSVKPFGEIQLQLPIKEKDLPSEEKLEVSLSRFS